MNVLSRFKGTVARKGEGGPGPIRSAGLGVGLFLVSFFIGLSIFVHWDSFWKETLQSAKASGKIPENLAWSELSNAGPFSFTLKGVRYSAKTLRVESDELHFRGISGVLLSNVRGGVGQKAFQADRIAAEPGFSPRLTVKIETGETLTIERYADGELAIEGAFVAAKLLPDSGLSGLVRLDGDFIFSGDSWPKSGKLQLLSDELLLPNAIKLAAFTFSASLNETTVDIEEIAAAGPIPFECAGEATLDQKNFINTRYSVKGQTFLGDTPKPFTSKGSLKRFLKG